MNLGEALQGVISGHVKSTEPASPPSSDRGRIARMNHLEKAHGGPRQAAAAVGVSRETWRRWRLTGTDPRTGRKRQGPSGANLASLTRTADQLYNAIRRRSVDRWLARVKHVKVWAVVNWNGYTNKQDGGYRRNGVNLDRLPTGALARLGPAWELGDQAALAGLFEAAVSSAYDGDIVNFEGDNVRVTLR